MLRVKREFADDEANSETVTGLRMLVGGPGRPTSTGRAIHWHANPDVKIEFVYTDVERQTIPYVRSTDKSGRVKEYKTEGTTDQQIGGGQRRVMDCIDCHNIGGAPDRDHPPSKPLMRRWRPVVSAGVCHSSAERACGS